MSKRSDEIWTLKLYREFHGLNYGRHSYSGRNSQRPVKNHQNYGSVHFHGRGMPRQTVIFEILPASIKATLHHKNTTKPPISTP